MNQYDEELFIFLGIYFNYLLLVENEAATESVINYLKKEGFTLKINTYLDYYLSWKIMMSEDKKLRVLKSSTYLQKLSILLDLWSMDYIIIRPLVHQDLLFYVTQRKK